MRIRPRLAVSSLARTRAGGSSLALLAAIGLLGLASCADSVASTGTDAGSMPPPPPISLGGEYTVRSLWSLASPPPGVAPVLAELAAATDGPDDPSRYVIDRMVARIDDPRVQAFATAVAPYLAAYVQSRIDEVAPELADGTRALAAGLSRIAVRFGTRATLSVDDDGRARQTITGAHLDGIDLAFEELGLPDASSELDVALDDNDRLTLSPHAALVPYASLLRAGLDRAVVPRVVEGARSLDEAFAGLVDCDALGTAVSEYLGLGGPALYTRACRVGLARVASEIHARLGADPASLAIAGVARAVDSDRDGSIDVIADGTWSGTFAGAPLGAAIFEGSAR